MNNSKSKSNKEQVRHSFEKLCFDLNMDKETSMDAWNSYESLGQHYLFQGDQIHWLAVSLYISCRRTDLNRKSENNPISIDRLLKSANNLSLIEFFDKVHKWEDMSNLTDEIRTKLGQLENAFHLSSCVFHKYPKMFTDLFGGSESTYLSFNYQGQRKVGQINPKYNQRAKSKSFSTEDFFSVGWTLFALSKTIYPSIYNDLVSSFHLLIATFQYLYEFILQVKAEPILRGRLASSLSMDLSVDQLKLIELLCENYGGKFELCASIYEEHFHSDIFRQFVGQPEINTDNCSTLMREINRSYDEIVIRNCIIDERIFLDHSLNLNEFCDSFNENRNQLRFDNRTPLTAKQHFVRNQSDESNDSPSNSCRGLTPISHVNLLVNHLDSIIHSTNTKHSALDAVEDLITDKAYLEHFNERIDLWKLIYKNRYDSTDLHLDQNKSNERRRTSQSLSSERYFHKGFLLFSRALHQILSIERKRLVSSNSQHDAIQQSFQKLIQNNEFLKSLLGLSLLIVFYAHGDNYHDFHWIFDIYELHGYSFLKIIQIFLKTLKEFNQTRSFIKYLSKIEETILSSMVWTEDSSFWTDLERKGFLKYEQVYPTVSHPVTSNEPRSTPMNLAGLYARSPSKPVQNVSRKLFDSIKTNEKSSSLVRSHSDSLVEPNQTGNKTSPYSMFFRKLYDLVLSRLDLLSVRLFGSNQSVQHQSNIWNLFLFIFEEYHSVLFKSRDLDQIILSIIYFYSNPPWNIDVLQPATSQPLSWPRLIQIYKSMPNSRLNIVRSVFIDHYSDNSTLNLIQFDHHSSFKNDSPSLTPSKPAGTIHKINGQFIGDITSFYKYVFLRVEHFQDRFNKYFIENPVRVLPQRKRFGPTMSNDGLNIKVSSTNSVHYSSNEFQSGKNSSQTQSSAKVDCSAGRTSSQVVSSSIQAGQHNLVQTTRMRTLDGKFLTTISTISNNLNQKSSVDLDEAKLTPDKFKTESTDEKRSSNDLYHFGQTDSFASKRTFSKSSSLDSFKSKVFIIENDRSNIS